MARTTIEVITRATRIARIVGHDETPDGDIYADALLVLEGLLAEIGDYAFDINVVPDECYIPLSGWLAAELAPNYGLPAEGRRSARRRFLASIKPDDRTDPADLNDSGRASAEEVAAFDAGKYF